ncbi:ABC transporter ATP-binding protein (plasmid) [Priestia aryabhattai]
MVANVMWKLISYKPFLFIMNLIMWTIIYTLPLVPGLITKEFFDSLNGNSRFDLQSIIWAIALVIAVLVRIAFVFLGNVIDVKFRFKISSLVRKNILESILFNVPGAQALNYSSKEAITYFRDDVDVIEDSISWIIDLFGKALFAILAFIIMFNISPNIVIFVFLPLIAIVLIIQKASSKLNYIREQGREATQQVLRRMGDLFNNIQSVKIEGAENNCINSLKELNSNREKWLVKDKTLNQVLTSTNSTTINLGTGLILLISASGLRENSLTIGDFALFIYYLTFVSNFTLFFGQFLAQYKQTRVSIERLTNLSTGINYKSITKKQKLTASKKALNYERKKTVKKELEYMEVQNLTFFYPQSQNGLKDINFSIKRGTFNVIAGKVGAGKSTLLKSIIGLFSLQKGQVFWNGQLINNPKDFFKPPISAYTPQIPWFFSGTLKENIIIDLVQAEKNLDQSLYFSNLSKDIPYLEDGLNTNIGSNAVKLSGGQAQRLSIARMLYREAELYVCDDISSALDTETERELWKRLKTQFNTFLIVSHSKVAFEIADNIIVLDDGKIIASGDLRELMESEDKRVLDVLGLEV